MGNGGGDGEGISDRGFRIADFDRGQQATDDGPPSTVHRQLSNFLRVSFHHGLGDCYYFAHLIPLYVRRGYGIEVECSPDKRILFAAAGAAIIDASRLAREAPEAAGTLPPGGPRAARPTLPPILPHPWGYPPGGAHRGHGHYWQGSKIGHNISETPLPFIGDKGALWDELCAERIDIEPHLPSEALSTAEHWLARLPRPVILLHTKGNTGQDRKSLPDATALEFYKSLLDRFDGSIVLLDWDNRVPRLASYRVRHLDELGPCPTDVMLALMCRADLMIGVDSGPLHAARFTRIPTVGVWMPGHYPATYTLPRPEQLNVVLADCTREWNRYKRIPWNIVEHPGTAYQPDLLAELCLKMHEPPRYLAPASDQASGVAGPHAQSKDISNSGPRISDVTVDSRVSVAKRRQRDKEQRRQGDADEQRSTDDGPFDSFPSSASRPEPRTASADAIATREAKLPTPRSQAELGNEIPDRLMPELRAADAQLQQFVREWCRGCAANALSAFADRHRSLDLLLREMSARFAAPVVVETGTIRAEEDWGGAGFSTYLIGRYLSASRLASGGRDAARATDIAFSPLPPVEGSGVRGAADRHSAHTQPLSRGEENSEIPNPNSEVGGARSVPAAGREPGRGARRGVLHSVDLSPQNCAFAEAWTRIFGDTVRVHVQDSVRFLHEFPEPIDVLYLDSLDTTEPGHAEHCERELEAAWPKLHERSLVLIDDTPWQGGAWVGKGARVVPLLLSRGWRILYAGYQVLLAVGQVSNLSAPPTVDAASGGRKSPGDVASPEARTKDISELTVGGGQLTVVETRQGDKERGRQGADDRQRTTDNGQRTIDDGQPCRFPTPCECTGPGWCPRHQVAKNRVYFEYCRRLPAWFDLWEQGVSRLAPSGRDTAAPGDPQPGNGSWQTSDAAAGGASPAEFAPAPGGIPANSATARPPCRHLGGELRRVQCPTCRGHVELKIFACALHEECALSANATVRACPTCVDHDPAALPDP